MFSRSYWAMHVAVFLFGLTGLFGKWLDLPPTIIVAGRVFFGALALFVYLLLKKEKIFFKEAKDYAVALGLGGLLAFHWFTFFYAIQLSTVSLVLMTYASFPVFVTFLEPLFFKNKLKKWDVLMAVLVSIGLLMIVPGEEASGDEFSAIFWGLASGLAIALLQLGNKERIKKEGAVIIAFYQNVFAFLLLAPFCFMQMESIRAMSQNDFLLILALGILCTGLAPALFIFSMKKLSAQFVSVVAILETVYAILLAHWLLDETLTGLMLLGGSLIILTTAIHSYYFAKTKSL